MSAREIIDIYISFFEKSPRNHKRISNSPLVPENDPTTLFTSSGMQPLIPYLLGEEHPAGKRLVNVQNCFRAVDIDEVGDNRHTTFFRMLGNWSLGDYFKEEEIGWLWSFLTEELKLPKEKLYVNVFGGWGAVEKDELSYQIWTRYVPKEKIFFAGIEKNWWSRSGIPKNMPVGEIGGPDTEVYFRFDDLEHEKKCKDNPVDCECGKFLEIANSVFIEYQSAFAKASDGHGKQIFKKLKQQNVDFGGGVERLLAATEEKSDIFQTSLFAPIITSIEKASGKSYRGSEAKMRIAADHLRASVYLLDAKVTPSNKDRGYILRRLIRRALDNLEEAKIEPILLSIVEECSKTDPSLSENFEFIKLNILQEEKNYKDTLGRAHSFIDKKYPGKEVEGVKEISAQDAFLLYSTHGLSPTQITSLGYIFDEQSFAKLMEEHQKKSKTAGAGMFRGGLADHSEQTIRGHTATHLVHQALRDMLGTGLHQTGSNITAQRVRFDFNFDRSLTPEEVSSLEDIVNGKIKENLPVHFEMMTLAEAKKAGAIGLFDDKYADKVKVYFIGEKTNYYSKEFCGGPHVSFTGEVKSFKIIKQENLGRGYRRLYAKVG